MAPFTAWLPARPNQDCDLLIKIAGRAVPSLTSGIVQVSQALADQGLAVIAEAGKLNGGGSFPVASLRIASKTSHSLGHGCDVLLHLEDDIPDFRRFGLQRGSVLLWEPPMHPRLEPIVPEGVVAYPVPLRELNGRCGEKLLGKGLIALGVLMQLLGTSDALLRTPRVPATDRRYLDAGIQFAREHLVKRDVYSLPSAPNGRSRLMLNAEQAARLGLAIGLCTCGDDCRPQCVRSPTQWVADHLAIAGTSVSVLESAAHPGVQAYRGPEGTVIALLRGDNDALSSCIGSNPDPRVFVAGDVPDIIRLLGGGHRLIHNKGAGVVCVLVEDAVASRIQTVEIESVAEASRLALPDAAKRHETGESVAAWVAEAELDYHPGADIGYVAWGSAQGVVRDAVALCREFGLGVAALYPKAIQPPPVKELEAFGAAVTRLVVVESDASDRFSDLVRRVTSLRPATVRPESGKALTPMDIFLREGLGAL